MTVTVITRSADQTRRLGKQIGSWLTPGAVFVLAGALGCGKTTFVQGLARGLGVPDDNYVTSPTYILVNEYPGRIPLAHADLYRLSGPQDAEDIGLAELFDGRGVVALEWGKKIKDLIPADHLALEMRVLPDESRRIRLKAAGTAARQVLIRLMAWLEEKEWD